MKMDKAMANARILVVEDEGIIAKDIRKMLENLGYDVFAVVSSGEDAVKKAAETHPDLVLMDIVLEGDMDGVEAAEQIRNRFDIPVIYLTAYSDEKTLQRAKITEPYGYIFKPFQGRELHTAIEMALYRHKMERKLNKSEKKYRQLIENIEEGIWVIDDEAKTAFVNSRMAAMLGYTVDEMIGRSLFSFMGKSGLASVNRCLESVKGGVKDRCNSTFFRKDGTRIYTSRACSPIIDDTGNYVGVFSLVSDITERKRAEETIDWLSHLNELILNSAGEGIFGLDLQGKAIFVNPVAAEMFGWDLEELADQSLHDIIHHSRANGAAYSRKECPICAVFRDGRIRHGDDELFWRKDGTNFPVEYVGTPIREQGAIVGAVVTFKDITERKRLRDSLLKSERRLRTLSSSLLAAQEQERKRISHELHDDLGQILTAILLDVRQATKQSIPDDSGISGFLSRIQTGTEEALQRARSISSILRPGVLDHIGLKAAVVSFLEDFRERTGLDIVEEIQMDSNDISEPVNIAIYRVFQEATTNIAKHAAAKQVIVELRSNQEAVVLCVTDDGQGFHPGSLGMNQGLGLLGMKERVEWLGGVFSIESAHNRGTKIYAESPVSAQDPTI
ncbi:MAG: PAS domain S-box protein [Deltaproteobacteria bacterium]|nr:PAS domain S-box protein [Deltaproteobacteria bacterium]